MSKRTFLSGVMLLIIAGPARADYEADLLARYAKRSESAASKWKQEVESVLARAAVLAKSEPEEAVKMLRKAVEKLEADKGLPASERAVLSRRLFDEQATVQRT